MPDRSARRTAGTTLVVIGCGLLALATIAPVMRWEVNAAHETAGSARIWLGDAWTLADGGFQGASLLPLASVAVLVLAGVALFGRGSRRWWRATVVLAAVAAYVPLWTAVAFARKLEDQVEPDIGAWLLVAGAVTVTLGVWLSRPMFDSTTRPRREATGPPATPAEHDGLDLR